MAFENLEPHREAILSWRQEGLTLAQVIDRLATDYQVTTSPGTLSRFLRSGGGAVRAVGKDERNVIDALALLTEILAEIRGRGDEQRMAIEHLAGQIRILTEVVEESAAERTSRPNPGAQASRWGFWAGAVVGAACAASIVLAVFLIAPSMVG